jgi:deoxyribonuclease-4
MQKEIKFGCAGNPVNFFKSEFRKDRFGVLEWSHKLGLNAQERQMTYGARMKEEDAVRFGELAKKFNISLSIHGPYYVVLTSEKEKVAENSIKELIKTCKLAELMNAKKVVFHPGFGKNVDIVIKRLKIIEKDKPKNVKICPETMGKISQLGSLNDVIKICENTECIPCVDFAHLYARSRGNPKTTLEFSRILEEIEKRLGKKVLEELHCHFYPVEYGEKGEKVHRAVMEKNVFPRFIDFAPLIKEFKMYPTLISESKNSQDIGALEMKNIMSKI